MGQLSDHDHPQHRTVPVRRTPRLLLAVVIALALLAAACGSSKKSDQTSSTTPDGDASVADEGTPVDGGSLVIGIAAETNGWNPSNNQWADTGSLVGSSVLEPLATVGADKGAKPWLADSWYPNDDLHQLGAQAAPGHQVPQRPAVRRPGRGRQHRGLQEGHALEPGPRADARPTTS